MVCFFLFAPLSVIYLCCSSFVIHPYSFGGFTSLARARAYVYK